MSDRLGMQIEINFESINNVDNKIKKLLKELQSKNQLNITVDPNAFKKIESQFNELKKKFEQSLNVNTDTSKINSAVVDLTKNIGNLDKKQIKLIDGEQVQLIEQSKKSLLEAQKIIYDFKSNKITEVNTADYGKAQSGLYKELNTLQNEEFNIKNKLIGQNETIKTQLQGQLSSVEQQQSEVRKLIEQNNLQSDDKNKNLLIERNKLTSDLTIAQEKFNNKSKMETEELEKQIKNYKEMMSIKAQNLQTKYGSLVNSDEISNFKKSLDELNVNNFDKGAISNEFAKIESNVKANSSALKIATKDAESFGSVLLHDLQMFGMWMVTGSIIMQSFKFFTDGVSYVNDLNRSLTEISVVTGKTQSQVRDLGFEYAKLAKEMSVSTKEIASSATEYYRQGLSQSDVMERLKTTTQYAKISNLDFKQSAEILTATVNSMGVSIERASDVFSYLGDATATGADEIGIAMSKVAGSASIAQIPLEKISSWINDCPLI